MLRQRVLTALAFGAVALVAVFLLPTWAMAGVVALALLVGAWEWAGFAHWPPLARLGYSGALALLMAGTAPISQNPGLMFWVMVLAGLWWLVALIWLFRFPTPIPSWLIGVAGVCVLLPAWLALTYLHGREPLGPALVFLVLVAVWSADVGAYFVGSHLGRFKLAPRVSPGKTWEGVLGGIAAAGTAAIVVCLLIDAPWPKLLPIVLFATAVSVVGDLTVSMFKRNAGLKDSGAIFPGHGGMMDRLDSMAAAAPVFVLGLAATQTGN